MAEAPLDSNAPAVPAAPPEAGVPTTVPRHWTACTYPTSPERRTCSVEAFRGRFPHGIPLVAGSNGN